MCIRVYTHIHLIHLHCLENWLPSASCDWVPVWYVDLRQGIKRSPTLTSPPERAGHTSIVTELHFWGRPPKTQVTNGGSFRWLKSWNVDLGETISLQREHLFPNPRASVTLHNSSSMQVQGCPHLLLIFCSCVAKVAPDKWKWYFYRLIKHTYLGFSESHKDSLIGHLPSTGSEVLILLIHYFQLQKGRLPPPPPTLVSRDCCFSQPGSMTCSSLSPFALECLVPTLLPSHTI